MPRIERFLCLTLATGILSPVPVLARAADGETIHWACSTWFGTGWHRTGSTRDAFAVRFAPRRLIAEQSMEGGERRYGIEVRVPLTVGLEHFSLEDLSVSARHGR